jgi:hypothetical protein
MSGLAKDDDDMMTCAPEHRSLVGCSGDFTSVAEVARIQLRPFEKTPDCFNSFNDQRAQSWPIFSGIALLKTGISATLVRVEIAPPPPSFPYQEPLDTGLFL